jgi:ATP-dependent RNA helicase DeaD
VHSQEQVGAEVTASVFESGDSGEVESPRKSLLRRVEEQLQAEAVSQEDVVYRLAVGHRDRVKPGMIVGAIANEAGVAGKSIGNIQIEFDHTLVVMPALTPGQEDMLQRTRVAGVPLKLERAPEGTVVESFKPSFGGDSRPPSRGGFQGGGRERGFERRDSFRDRDTGGFRGPRDRNDDREFRRPAYGDRDRGSERPRYEDRGDRRRDEGGSSAPFRGGPPRRGFGIGGGGYSGQGGGSRPPFRRDGDDRPPFRKDRDDRPDYLRDRNDWQEERPRRDDRGPGGPPRKDFRPGGKPKPRFEPPWGFPKGSKPGKPKR